ncbi:uncharacterized protein J7T54_007205, partial [Emericellopsis cladophorae]
MRFPLHALALFAGAFHLSAAIVISVPKYLDKCIDLPRSTDDLIQELGVDGFADSAFMAEHCETFNADHFDSINATPDAIAAFVDLHKVNPKGEYYDTMNSVYRQLFMELRKPLPNQDLTLVSQKWQEVGSLRDEEVDQVQILLDEVSAMKKTWLDFQDDVSGDASELYAAVTTLENSKNNGAGWVTP